MTASISRVIFPRLAIAGVGALLSLSTQAADPRIRSIDYDDGAVVRLDACYGFQTMIEFAADERIENVGLGEAAQWLVVPNKRANLLFVKPSYKIAHSNMTVATDHRRYSFELLARDSAACRSGRVVYNLRFRYPQQPPTTIADSASSIASEPPPVVAAELPPLPARNSAYTYSGARELVPLRVFDDGKRTWFSWGEGAGAPAVFAVGSDGAQTLVGFTAQQGWLIADQVAANFVLQRGQAQATLFNDGWQTAQLDAQSPQPRPAACRRRWFARGCNNAQ
jgi:type IV secretion system protein VirB9